MKSDQKSGFRSRWERAVCESLDLSGTAKLVLLVLATFADMDGGSCFPGQERLAKESRKSERVVRRALKEAEEAGFIVRYRRQYGMDRLSNLYELLIPGEGEAAAVESGEPPEGGVQDTDPVALWLDARTTRTRDDTGLQTTSLFADYKAWSKSCGFPLRNLNNFSKALVRLVGPPKHTSRGSLHPLLVTNTAKESLR